MTFQTSPLTAPERKTLARFDMNVIIKPKNALRWEYLRDVVPSSVLNELSVFVLKAAIDGCYGLSPKQEQELEVFADYIASLPGFKLRRLGGNNKFTNLVRTKRAQLPELPVEE